MGAEPGRPCRVRVIVAARPSRRASSAATSSSASSSLEVGGGGVEEQQVHFEVQQVGDLAKYTCLSRSPRDGVQPVHRPVARVVGRPRRARRCARPRLIHSAAASFEDGASARLATRPNSTRSAAAAISRPAPPADASPARIFPMPSRRHSRVEHVRAAVGPGLGERQLAAGGGGRARRPGPAAGTATRPAAGSRPCRAGPRGRSCRAIFGTDRPRRRRPTRCGPAAGTGPRRSWSSGWTSSRTSL